MGAYSGSKRNNGKTGGGANNTSSEESSEKRIQINISEDKLSAYLVLKKPQEGEAHMADSSAGKALKASGNGQTGYDVDEVLAAINAAGIKENIKEELVKEMVSKGIYDAGRLIAEGVPCKDGTDGYFEYFFHQKDGDSGKPRILDDGSVDYTSVNTVGTVSVGDLLAVYHPSKPGHFGYSVTGELLKPKQPKGLPVPQLIGCHYEEESYSYYADIDGKVEATPSKLQVIGTLEINRNINVAYGSIYFIGDVVVYGDVDSGVEITATGSVTIGGTLQGSSVRAGENISVRGGILGDERTIITCGGDLESRFLQYVNVVAGGEVKAKSILDCTIRAGGMVRVEDTNGVISGGFIYSSRGVDGQAIGNRRGVKTILAVGKSAEVLERRVEYPGLIEQLETKLVGINSREIQLGREARNNPSMSNLLHIVRQNKARILTEKKQLEAVYTTIDVLYGKNPMRGVISGRKFYPGTIVRIDMREKKIDDEMIRVSFRGSDDGISFSFDKDEEE